MLHRTHYIKRSELFINAFFKIVVPILILNILIDSYADLLVRKILMVVGLYRECYEHFPLNIFIIIIVVNKKLCLLALSSDD